MLIESRQIDVSKVVRQTENVIILMDCIYITL
uniref:Uncharacterized protein n=1 Tax=Anguilla anguilla TaxID=7936 RepID=A0A0E9UL27_ANGAN